MAKYAKGSVHPSELQEFEDSQTGAHIYQLTNDNTINHNLYFLTPSFTPDQSHLIFTSYRSGKANFFKLEFPKGDIVQLTNGDEVHGYSRPLLLKTERNFFTQKAILSKQFILTLLKNACLQTFRGVAWASAV